VKRQQVVARDHDAHLDWSQPVGGLVGRRLTLDVAPEREGDGLSVGVEHPHGVSVAGPRQSAKGALGNTQRLDETVAARLTEGDVEPEEAALGPEGGDPRLLRRIEPGEDVRHALAD
jgi:hypothetical protein